MASAASRAAKPLAVTGLFAGIGGFELGFQQAGHHTVLLAENFEPARAVLKHHFSDVRLESDVANLKRFPRDTDVLVAGFPCQDLSSVGQKRGIEGARSSLVGEVFRLLKHQPARWVVLENVPFLLQLGRGKALAVVTSALAELGYAWAYRVIDSLAFGLPQRRRRWYLVASLEDDPRGVLLGPDVQPPAKPDHREVACGFYWTEGMRALGWAIDAVPPIKGGSTVGVPSPPAIQFPSGEIVTPDLRDTERLQGFDADWTLPAETVARRGFRWSLVGNAVSVNTVKWLGERLVAPTEYDDARDKLYRPETRWPYAAWSLANGEAYEADASPWPVWYSRPPLHQFLRYPVKPLSARAAAGFLARTKRGSLRFPDGFIENLQAHIDAYGAAA
jgi:DNA (cytosine-5)-methyltransferase 1